MSRETYVIRNGKLTPKRLALPLTVKDDAPFVIGDMMEPVKHMGTGRIHDSKANFRADTRATGGIEVGNDPAVRKPLPRQYPTMNDVVADVKKSIQQLNSGTAPRWSDGWRNN